MGLYDAMTNCRYSYLETLHDICLIGTSGSSVNSFGEVDTTVTNGSPVSCALHMDGGIKSVNGQYLKTENDATLRLPLDTIVAIDSTVTVTCHYGETVNLVYRVNSEPRIGIAGMVVELKKVTT